MARLLLMNLLFCVPLAAVTPSFNEPVAHKFELERATVHLHITKDETGAMAQVYCEFAIHNRGEARNLRLALPQSVIPKDQQKKFRLTGDEKLPEAKVENESFVWLIAMEADARLTASWAWQARPARLLNEHPLGNLMVRVPLTYAVGFSKLPEVLEATVSWEGLDNQRFGQTEDATLDISVNVNNQLQNLEYRFFATTLENKLAALAKRLRGFTEKQRVATNRSYTETLVLLADVLELAGDKDESGKIFAKLADLEVAAGHAITHCGPAAEWRKYVPWRLRQAGLDSQIVAKEATAMMSVRWDAYLDARKFPRPFDHFDAVKYGNYWDYDWDQTRELYAKALESIGETAAADTVRNTEVSHE